MLGGLGKLRDSLSDYLLDVAAELIQSGGEFAPIELREERKTICNSCPHKGIVTPLPFTKAEGCEKCGCVLATKIMMLSHRDTKTLKVIKTECPLGKWNEIDKKFKSNK